jgi:hypothetical protein
VQRHVVQAMMERQARDFAMIGFIVVVLLYL